MDDDVRKVLDRMQERMHDKVDKGFEKVFEKLDRNNEHLTRLTKTTAILETAQKNDQQNIKLAHDKIDLICQKEDERSYKALKYAGALIGIMGGLAGAASFFKLMVIK